MVNRGVELAARAGAGEGGNIIFHDFTIQLLLSSQIHWCRNAGCSSSIWRHAIFPYDLHVVEPTLS